MQRRFLAHHSVATLFRTVTTLFQHCFEWLQHCSNIVSNGYNIVPTLFRTVTTLFQHCFERLQHCSNIATPCCDKNRRCKSSRVTPPLMSAQYERRTREIVVRKWKYFNKYFITYKKPRKKNICVRFAWDSQWLLHLQFVMGLTKTCLAEGETGRKLLSPILLAALPLIRARA